MTVDFVKISEKWQKRWEKDKIFQVDGGDPEDKNKFFITAAFPYLNGVLHAGHLRTFTIPEVVARYQRMKGKRVLWTMGYHVSGTPILGLAELIRKRDKRTLKAYSELHKIPMEVLLKLDTPEAIVEYFSERATRAFKKMGFSFDWRRNFTTDDETFKKFVEWQFLRLKEKGYIRRGSHPVRYCPSCDNPVEDHDLLEGEDATLVEYILIKFKGKIELDGREEECIVPMATLRPETVFGVVNAWVNPEGKYVVAKVYMEVEEGKLEYRGIWIVSEEAAEKLRNQGRVLEVIKEIKGEELVGKTVINPVNNREVPIYPAKFVDTSIGTGFVMSVPAHAPYDYVALRDYYRSMGRELKEEDLIPLIKLENYGKYPAKEIVERMGIKSQEEREKLEEATSKIYREEYHKGVLNENCGEYSGMPVKEAKEIITRDLLERGIGEILYEFSEPNVICRCGTRCIVKLVKGQWFITYSDKEWKKLAHRCVDMMEFIPESLRKEFHNKIDWMKDKACARRRGLGTRLPFDREWVIESLSDSTIYMAYYTIAKTINMHNIREEQLLPQLFDYIFYGEGDIEEISKITEIPRELIEEMRREFLYFYPLDWRCSAKDLISNHLTFMIFNHVALFPEEFWPRGIVVNGYVTIEGRKLSKSKGPLLPMEEVAEMYGPDVGRFYITTCAELPHDADIKFREMKRVRDNLERFYHFAQGLTDVSPEDINYEDLSVIDRWLLHRLHKAIKLADESYSTFQLRRVGILFYQLINDLKWYRRRGGDNRELLRLVAETWVKILAPMTPHLCEEIWELFGKKSYISLETFPVAEEKYIDDTLELGEEFLASTIEDIRRIVEIAKIKPKKIYLYTADPWKYQVLKIMNENRDRSIKELISIVMKDPELRRYGKEVVKLIRELMEMGVKPVIDEEKILRDGKSLIEREFGCEVIINGEDKGNKKRQAIPYRVAIYLE
ncbi:MAG TPA: leucine--tRNA ligase [Methanothermococcus okinawensis]|uniref:Leucine--tRNA ligase n=1 Tax=Methanothermococcus okinawensis TaxID=155863 RepID=A0A832ZYU8_9EURY|nr:leucine--tRNA ligase [Methanothermococcus okinawensis]